MLEVVQKGLAAGAHLGLQLLMKVHAGGALRRERYLVQLVWTH